MLGLDMSSAVNIFLKQCIFHGGLPFEVAIPDYALEVHEAMEEAKQISRDPNVPAYPDMDSLIKSLDA